MPTRAQKMLVRAREIAATGECRDWTDVADMLVLEGYPIARAILDNPITRADLDRVCKAHWTGGS